MKRAKAEKATLADYMYYYRKEQAVALERARAVGVLDAWADRSASYGWSCKLTVFRGQAEPDDAHKYVCHLTLGRGVSYFGPTADAARAAAVEAIEKGRVAG